MAQLALEWPLLGVCTVMIFEIPKLVEYVLAIVEQAPVVLLKPLSIWVVDLLNFVRFIGDGIVILLHLHGIPGFVAKAILAFLMAPYLFNLFYSHFKYLLLL